MDPNTNTQPNLQPQTPSPLQASPDVMPVMDAASMPPPTPPQAPMNKPNMKLALIGGGIAIVIIIIAIFLVVRGSLVGSKVGVFPTPTVPSAISPSPEAENPVPSSTTTSGALSISPTAAVSQDTSPDAVDQELENVGTDSSDQDFNEMNSQAGQL